MTTWLSSFARSSILTGGVLVFFFSDGGGRWREGSTCDSWTFFILLGCIPTLTDQRILFPGFPFIICDCGLIFLFHYYFCLLLSFLVFDEDETSKSLCVAPKSTYFLNTNLRHSSKIVKLEDTVIRADFESSYILLCNSRRLYNFFHVTNFFLFNYLYINSTRSL